MTDRKCRACGGKVVLQPSRGPFPWKDFPALHLENPISLLRCNQCGRPVYQQGDAKAIDSETEKSIQSFTEQAISQILEREDCTQSSLAERLGITKTHLSAVKNGNKPIGFQTFNFLKVMALVPAAFTYADPSLDIVQAFANMNQSALNPKTESAQVLYLKVKTEGHEYPILSSAAIEPAKAQKG